MKFRTCLILAGALLLLNSCDRQEEPPAPQRLAPIELYRIAIEGKRADREKARLELLARNGAEAGEYQERLGDALQWSDPELADLCWSAANRNGVQNSGPERPLLYWLYRNWEITLGVLGGLGLLIWLKSRKKRKHQPARRHPAPAYRRPEPRPSQPEPIAPQPEPGDRKPETKSRKAETKPAKPATAPARRAPAPRSRQPEPRPARPEEKEKKTRKVNLPDDCVLFIDTNIWMDEDMGPLFGLVQHIAEKANWSVHLEQMVLGELKGLSNNPAKQAAARLGMRRMEQLQEKLGTDRAYLCDNSTPEDDIADTLLLREAERTENAVLITRDRELRILARSKSINAPDPRDLI